MLLHTDCVWLSWRVETLKTLLTSTAADREHREEESLRENCRYTHTQPRDACERWVPHDYKVDCNYPIWNWLNPKDDILSNILPLNIMPVRFIISKGRVPT